MTSENVSRPALRLSITTMEQEVALLALKMH
jgi:hypothetical protein